MKEIRRNYGIVKKESGCLILIGQISRLFWYNCLYKTELSFRHAQNIYAMAMLIQSRRKHGQHNRQPCSIYSINVRVYQEKGVNSFN